MILSDSGPKSKGIHLALMQLLNDQPACLQRELSRRLGWSLGKTHYPVHALLEKDTVPPMNTASKTFATCHRGMAGLALADACVHLMRQGYHGDGVF